jgi:hypothetical protein
MTDAVIEHPPYIEQVEQLLEGVDPNHLGQENWALAVGAIFNQTGGSEAGLSLTLRWSRKLTDYPGDNYVASFWLLVALLALKDLGGDNYRALLAEYAREDAMHQIAIAQGRAGQGQST